MKKIILSTLVASSLLMGSNSVQININNDTLEVAADIYLNDKYEVNNSSNYYFTASYLRTEDTTSESTASLSSAGFKVLNPYTDDNGASFGMGMKAVYADNNDNLFFAAPLAIYAKYEHNEKIYFDAELSYAPRVLSFSDAETYNDMKFKANYKVLEDGYAFIGYRNIETKYDNMDAIEYDKELFVGYEVKF